MAHDHARRPVTMALGATGLSAARCSGGGDDPEDQMADFEEWAACMRGEGIDMPDPVTDEEGDPVVQGDGVNIGAAGASFSNGNEDGGEPAFTPERQSDNDSAGDPEAGDGTETGVNLGPFGEIDMDDADTAAAFEACEDLMGHLEAGPGPDENGGDA